MLTHLGYRNAPRWHMGGMIVIMLLLCHIAVALPLQSDHGTLRAVPTLRPVTIDGDLSDWDLSGEMYVYGVRAKRDRYSVRVHSMWDRDALYLGMHWLDPTPMFNKVDPVGEPGSGWMSDSFQARFTTDYGQIHLTAWYSSSKDMCITQINYETPYNTDGMQLYRAEGTVLRAETGYQMALKKDGDNRGYVQEIRIPWQLLYRNPPTPQDGLKFGFTGEFFWGGPQGTKWPAVQWADPVNQENPVRVVLYQNPNVWGKLELLAAGNLPRAATTESDMALQGTIPVRMEVPADATHFSLTIDDATGRRVRNLAAHARINDYLAKDSNGKRIIEVLWDGRADGGWNKDLSLFLGDLVAPGQYIARGMVHNGVGVTYAGSFYNPGNPPWATADGSGDWGYDHSNPIAVGAMPKEYTGNVRTFLGWLLGENGVGLIGIDANGNKKWSWVRHGVGAHHIATGKDDVVFIIGGYGEYWLAKVNPETGESRLFSDGKADIKLTGKPSGLAVHGDTVAIAFKDAGKVRFFNLGSGAMLNEVPANAPTSIAFTPNGALVGISGTHYFSIAPRALAALLFKLNGVSAPVALATDSQGKLYVSDAVQHTVKVFSQCAANATLVREIGEPGGHRPGPWNPQRMQAPLALAVDERAGATSVWTVEDNWAPRRVSVWGADGKLTRDYIGNTRYSGSGGLMSDIIPDLGIVDTVMFKVDYAKGTYRPVELMGGHPDPVPGKMSLFHMNMTSPVKPAWFGNGYHFISTASGKPVEYFIDAANASAMVFMKRGDRWLCVAALGPAILAPEGLPGGLKPATQVFAWNDLDKDGFQSPDEVTWRDMGKRHVLFGGWGYRCDTNLTFYHSGFAFKPTRFMPDGAPIYDLETVKPLPNDLGSIDGDIFKTRFGYVASRPRPNHIEKHNVSHGLHEYVGFDEEGRIRWTYPNYWIAVHGALNAPMAMPGVIMGALKITGIVDMGDYSIISIRGNAGQEFLLRDDGIYIGELFTDQRMIPSTMPEDKDIVGLPLNDMTMGGEPFNGWMARQNDGKVRMTYGNTDVRIAEVTGLNTIHTLKSTPLTLGEREIAQAKAFVHKTNGVDQKTEIAVARGGAFTTDASAFTGNDLVTIYAGREEVGKATLRYDDVNLYVAYRVFDSTPMINKGIDKQHAFKTGDSVSLFVARAAEYEAGAIDGTRVLMTAMGGKHVSMVYQPKSAMQKPFIFESPVRKTPFAYVAEEERITVNINSVAQGYILTATVPWQVLGITPSSGLRLRGDFGLLFGDDTGARTAQRVQWMDKETNVVNDVPSEAEFFPARWGTLILR